MKCATESRHVWRLGAKRRSVGIVLAGIAAVVAVGETPTAAPSDSSPMSNSDNFRKWEKELKARQPEFDTDQQVEATADYLAGYGKLALPFGLGLYQAYGVLAEPRIDRGVRDSTYYGTTLSWSKGETWYIDGSFASGTSRASKEQTFARIQSDNPVSFTIDDQWYQLYARRAFAPRMNGALNTYLRFGVTYADSAFRAEGLFNGVTYLQDSTFRDLMGDLGVGLRYTIHGKVKFRVMAFGEAEVFGGVRFQNISETIVGERSGTADLDTPVYGVLGRATLRLEYFLDAKLRFRLFGDAGIQSRLTFVDFKQGNGLTSSRTINEVVWGPYFRFGSSYSF